MSEKELPRPCPNQIAGSEHLGTFAAQHCGCKIVGNGTLQNSFDIERCPVHEQAPDLLAKLKGLVYFSVQTASGVSLGSLSAGVRRSIARAKSKEVQNAEH